MLTRLLKFLKKHKERATIAGLVFGLIFFVSLGIYLQKKHSHEKELPPKIEPTQIVLEIKQEKTAAKDNFSSKKTSSFNLRPSASELLEQLSGMENLQESVAQAKLQHLKVLWPVYYFGFEAFEGREALLLDSSKDGFGVEVIGHVKSTDYPLLNGLKAGDKIWVAGEIEAVAPSGTGAVYLKIELLDFTDDGPPAVIEESPATEE